MTEREAREACRRFKERTDISLEDSIKYFHFCLALRDYEQANIAQNRYKRLLEEKFLGIALTIEMQKSFETFIQWNDQLDILDIGKKEVLLALMYQKKDSIIDWTKVIEIFSDNHVYLDSVKVLGLCDMDIDELLKNYSEYSLVKDESYYLELELRRMWIYNDKNVPNSDYLRYFSLLDENRKDEANNLKKKMLDDILSKRNKKNSQETKYKRVERVEQLERTSKVNFSPSVTEEEIELFIEYLKISVENFAITLYEYDEYIIDIARSIAKTNPQLSYALLDKLWSNTAEIFDIHRMVIDALFQQDVSLGKEYFKKIEVNYPHADIFCDLINKNASKELTDALVEISDIFKESPCLHYKIMLCLNKIKPVDFETYYSIAKKIKVSYFNTSYYN